MFAGFGLASIRSNIGYRAHWLRCYFWYCLARLIVDGLILILFYAGVYKLEREWRETAFQVVSFVGMVVAANGFYFGRKLWHILFQIIREDIEGAIQNGHQPGVGNMLGVANAYPVQGPQANAYPMPAEAEPASATGQQTYPTASVGEPTGVVQAVPVAAPAVKDT
uniref:Uncharacterized protein n=1 Tax=Lotharella globosa TaxID=91324 RepID=A0A7S4DFK2_9EUKA